MNASRTSEQTQQESEYAFPYHYVSKMHSNGFSQHFVDSWGINYISTIEFLLSKIAQNRPNSIIDIGCGDGRFTREIHLKFPEIIVSGVDYSSRAISLAKAINQDLPSIFFQSLDITKAELDKKFELALLMEVLEHIPINNVDSFLQGIHRSLSKDGVLMITVPHINKKVEYKHFQHFSIASIEHALSKYFKVIEIVPFEKKSFLRDILNSVLCNRFFIINNQRILNKLYELHNKYLFNCSSESHCQRLYIKAVAR